MKVFAKFDEIPSMTLQDIKETKRYGHTFVRSFVRSDGQRENSIPSQTQFVGGYKKNAHIRVTLVSSYKNLPKLNSCFFAYNTIPIPYFSRFTFGLVLL